MPYCNSPIARTCLLWLLAATAGMASAARADLNSPVNQVFQFMASASCSSWSDGATSNATAYLWIPEDCPRLKGVLVLCNNVPEHLLVGHADIRRVCAANGLGIVWCTPSFIHFPKTKGVVDYATATVFLQQLLEGLARTSGYDEVATVPWLPMGESAHLLMVDALMESNPDRCIAGIFIKNNHLPPKNRRTPTLVIYGTAQEWSQDKTDIREKWREIGPAYEGILKQCKANPTWPFSYVIDGHSGHFDCSERLVKYIANYIDAMAKARLPMDKSVMSPVPMDDGFFADLPVPGHEGGSIKQFTEATSPERGVPWYPTRELAQEAQAIAAINWKAQTQLLGFLDSHGNVMPFDFNGIANLKSVAWENDHVTFSLQGKMLEQIPATFVGAGAPLAIAPGTPEIEWLCGAVAPIGNGRFRITLDRTYPQSAPYLAIRQDSTNEIRAVVQPIHIEMPLLRNNVGKAQTITFGKIPDVAPGTASVDLTATSDSGLPVEYFVEAGPAIVKDGKLVFTKIPPRAKYPVQVTVAAWQWGSPVEPQVKTAEIVRQTLQISSK